MDADTAVNVEVTISDELKRLLAVTIAQVWALHPGQRGAEPEPQLPQIESDVQWQNLVLRQDGNRPLAFRGLPIVSRTCVAASRQGKIEQTLSLYLAEDQAIFASLVFEPTATTPARPMYRCQPIRDERDFMAFLADWQPELCFEAAVRSGSDHSQDRAAELLAVRSAFNSMTADCLCKGVLQG